MKGFMQLADGSALTSDGKVAFVSQERFRHDVCEGECCFACLARPGEKPFNDEHVLPNWILGWQQMHAEEINLPDGSTQAYGSYKLPCCKVCNSAMGKRFENPISHLFKTSVVKAVKGQEGTAKALKIFQWMALIFVKVHLMDRKLYADGRAQFDWNDLHHAYSVARAFASGAVAGPRILGSMWALELAPDDGLEPFDYVDVTSCQTVMLRVGSSAVIAVLDDCCAVLGALRLPPITWRAGEANLQLREIVARVAYGNALLRERPVFHTRWRAAQGRFELGVELPPRPLYDDHDALLYGQILNHVLREPLGLDARPDHDPVKRAVREGRLSFLEGDAGEAASR
jgi:hypothetical protein